MSHDTGFPTWRLVAGVAVTGCLLLSFAWGADQGTSAVGYSYQKQVIARVGAVQGDTKVQRAGEAKFKKVAVKAPLYVMDFLATGKNSKLWWHGTFNAISPSEKWKPGPDVTEGSLGADSVFGFKQFERAGASYRFVGYVQKGTVRFIKTIPNTNPPSTFTIGTHTAWIEVVPSDRAADFIVESKNESLTTVTVLWGKVRVKNISPEIKESRILTSCQEVDVERDQEPGEIKWVSTDTMKELVKRTTIPKTLPEDVPSCERLKTEVILDLTEVYLPPPGVALYPAIVPVPVPGDKTECCPPGKTYDRRTGKCVCECPEGERPPVTVNSTNGRADEIGRLKGEGPCGSCRRGATFNSETCSCECPCPNGFVLPGQGCVSQCPEGYNEAYDSSNSPPYRCKYCVQYPPGIVVDPIPPPPRQCQDGAQCGACEDCFYGTCVSRVCKTGFYLDRGTCRCLPIADGKMSCTDTEGSCPQCQRCVNGACQPVVTCPDQQRLNMETCGCEPIDGDGKGKQPLPCDVDANCPGCMKCLRSVCVPFITACGPEQRWNPATCQCEPVNGSSKPSPVAPCSDNSECPQGYSCSQGQCVPQIPPAPEEPEIQCHRDSECGRGLVCRQGKCEPVGSKLCPGIVCGPEQRLNVDTCQCESSATPIIPHPSRPETPEIQHGYIDPTPQCQANSDCAPGEFCHNGMCQKPLCRANSDCAKGEICRKGKCVKKPPPRSIPKPSSGEENVVLPNLLEESSGSGIPGGGFNIGGGGGTGGGKGSVGTGGKQQLVPRLAPPKVAPIQRVPRRGRAN